MAWVVAAKPAAGAGSAGAIAVLSWRPLGFALHPSTNLLLTVYGYMDADAQRKRHRQYMKRQSRAAGKRALLQWRSLEMHADDYRESRERRTQKGRYDYYTKQQSSTRSEKAADSEDPISGSTGEGSGHGESESVRYRRHFWSSTWRGLGGWDSGTNSRWEASHQAKTPRINNIGCPSDRVALGLSPAGPLSLEELKLAFRQCALTWHPDRHDGHQKLLAEAKFKRVGDAYRTLRELLYPRERSLD